MEQKDPKGFCCGGKAYDRIAGRECCNGKIFYARKHICCGGNIETNTKDYKCCSGILIKVSTQECFQTCRYKLFIFIDFVSMISETGTRFVVEEYRKRKMPERNVVMCVAKRHGTINGKKFAWIMVSDARNQEQKNNVDHVILLILRSNRKLSAVADEGLIPYVSSNYNFFSKTGFDRPEEH